MENSLQDFIKDELVGCMHQLRIYTDELKPWDRSEVLKLKGRIHQLKRINREFDLGVIQK